METGYHLNMNHKLCTAVRQICYFISNSYFPPAELVFIRPFCFDWHSFLQLYRYLFLVSLNEGTRSLCKGRQQSNSSSWMAKQIVRWLFRSPLTKGWIASSQSHSHKPQSEHCCGQLAARSPTISCCFGGKSSFASRSHSWRLPRFYEGPSR